MSVEFTEASEYKNAFSLTGTGHCFASGRLSYVLGMQGECVSVDTACSSALVAFNSARQSIGDADSCTSALFAGVNLMFLPKLAHEYAAASLTSASGASMVFDARADGFVRGEGCAAGVLRATDADGGQSCLVSGSAVRQDGKSVSLTAPNGGAQQRLIKAVLADAVEVALAHLQLLQRWRLPRLRPKIVWPVRAAVLQEDGSAG